MTRRCGDCQLCCKLLPVLEINKRGGDRCKHQHFGKGCAVYAVLDRVSPSCRAWSCAWISGDELTSRPDRCHYVVDVMPDFVTVVDNVTGNRVAVPATQVWLDPGFPDAHRDPALRAYLARRGEESGACAVIRTGPKTGFVLMPPALCDDGRWHQDDTPPIERTHTPAQIFAALDGIELVEERGNER